MRLREPLKQSFKEQIQWNQAHCKHIKAKTRESSTFYGQNVEKQNVEQEMTFWMTSVTNKEVISGQIYELTARWCWIKTQTIVLKQNQTSKQTKKHLYCCHLWKIKIARQHCCSCKFICFVTNLYFLKTIYGLNKSTVLVLLHICTFHGCYSRMSQTIFWRTPFLETECFWPTLLMDTFRLLLVTRLFGRIISTFLLTVPQEV